MGKNESRRCQTVCWTECLYVCAGLRESIIFVLDWLDANECNSRITSLFGKIAGLSSTQERIIERG